MRVPPGVLGEVVGFAGLDVADVGCVALSGVRWAAGPGGLVTPVLLCLLLPRGRGSRLLLGGTGWVKASAAPEPGSVGLGGAAGVLRTYGPGCSRPGPPRTSPRTPGRSPELYRTPRSPPPPGPPSAGRGRGCSTRMLSLRRSPIAWERSRARVCGRRSPPPPDPPSRRARPRLFHAMPSPAAVPDSLVQVAARGYRRRSPPPPGPRPAGRGRGCSTPRPRRWRSPTAWYRSRARV